MAGSLVLKMSQAMSIIASRVSASLGSLRPSARAYWEAEGNFKGRHCLEYASPV